MLSWQKHYNSSMSTDFLPMSRKEMQSRGWEELDILFISADAYVDHPSFATALLCRLLESKGYRVGIVASRTGRIPSP